MVIIGILLFMSVILQFVGVCGVVAIFAQLQGSKEGKSGQKQ